MKMEFVGKEGMVEMMEEMVKSGERGGQMAAMELYAGILRALKHFTAEEVDLLLLPIFRSSPLLSSSYFSYSFSLPLSFYSIARLLPSSLL